MLSNGRRILFLLKGNLKFFNIRYRSGTVKDVTSARVSIPPQLVQRENKEKGVTEYVWKVDLMASQEHWIGIFIL